MRILIEESINYLWSVECLLYANSFYFILSRKTYKIHAKKQQHQSRFHRQGLTINKEFKINLKTLLNRFPFNLSILLNDKITIIVHLQYRKGFLVLVSERKEWKYYIILSHLMQIIKRAG